MSTTIDSRVVEMRFDNKQFESGVSTSMSTLEKLKQRLNFSGETKGLDNLGAAAKNVDLTGLGKGVETLKVKFSALQVMGVTALANITNAAMNAGIRITKALTIDPIKTGFQEYETQINAVQTILANTQSKGSTLNDVNAALDELNRYADMTIYNFTEMTRNIGTFTAAGVDLDTSVSAIKGIANLAAISGSTSQQASTAMYQLSQALASGTVKLMDWNSVVNAGMGGQVFQDALKETARVHGIAIDEMIKSEGSFRETLQHGWLSSEILTETLSKFTGDLSESQLKAMGYTEDQIKSIIKMGETANDAATKVKTFTQLFDTLKEAAQSGWTQSWEIMVGDFEEAKELLTGISNIISGMLNASAEARNKVLEGGLSSGWKQFLGEGIADEAAFKDAIQSVAKEHGIAVDEMIKKSGSFEKSLKEGWLTSDILSESLEKLIDKTHGLSDEELENIGYTRGQITELEKLGEAVKNGSISLDEYADKMTKVSGRENLIASLKNAFEGVMSVVVPIKEAFREVFPPITAKQLYDFTVKLKELTSHLKLSDANAENLKKTFKGIFSIFKMVIDVFSALADGALSIIGSLTGIEGGVLAVTGTIGAYISKLRESINSTNLLGSAIDFVVKIVQGFVGGFKQLLGIGAKAGDAFSNLGSGLVESFSGIDFSKSLDFINTGIFSGILLAIRNFIKGLSDPFAGGVSGFLNNIKGILDDVRGCFEAYQNQLKADALMKIAAAIAILAGALLLISSIDSGALAKSLAAITVLFAELMGSLSVFSNMKASFGMVVKGIPLMIGISSAIMILAGALKVLSTINTQGLVKGLAAIGVLMAELSIFLSRANFKGRVTTTAVGIMVLSTSLIVLSQAVKNFGAMKLSEIGKGLLAMSGALAVLAVAMKLMPKGLLSTGLGLMTISAAVGVLASSLGSFGSMDNRQIGMGLLAMGGALLELATALKFMSGTLTGSMALLVAAGALAVIAPTLKSLGSMSLKQIVKSLGMLAGAFAVLGIAGTLLSPLIPSILALSGAFALFGLSIIGIGAGLTLIGIGLTSIATGFTALATAGTVGATAFVAALSVIITGIIDLIPTIASHLGEGIIAICSVISKCAPQITECVLSLITEALAALAQYTPQIVDYLITFLIGVMDGVASRMPELVSSIVNLIGSLLKSIGEAFGGFDGSSLLKMVVGLSLLTGLMVALSALSSMIPGAMMGVLGLGAVLAELSLVLAAIGALAQIPGLEWLISEGGDFLQKVGTAIGQFIGGIVGGVAEGATAALPQIGTNLSGFMTNLQPFINGARQIDPAMAEGIGSLAKAVLMLTAADLLNAVTSFLTGGQSLTQFAQQLVPFGNGLKAYAESVAGLDAKAVANSAVAAKGLVRVAKAIPNSGGLVSLFTGDNNASDFAKQLVPFGKELKSYSDAVTGINTSAVDASVSVAKKLLSIIKSISNTEISGVSSYVSSVNKLATVNVKGVASAFRGTTTSLKSVGANMTSSIAKGMNSNKSSLSASASSLAGTITKAMQSTAGNFSKLGAAMIGKFASGMNSKKSTAGRAASSVAKYSASNLRGVYSSFYSAGSYLVSGFANGIDDNTYKASAKARVMANAASKAAKKALDEHSPSKVFYDIGDYAGLGFVNALNDHIKTSYSVAFDMASSAKSGLRKAVNDMSGLTIGEIDTQPTIKPIVDLSNVKSGAGAIKNLMNMGSSIDVLSNIGAINSMMNRRNQNEVNGEVVSAIDKLRKDLGNIERPSYTINGITYDDGSNIIEAVETLVRAAKVERRK